MAHVWLIELEDTDNLGKGTGDFLGFDVDDIFRYECLRFIDLKDAIQFYRKEDAEKAAPFLAPGVPIVIHDHEHYGQGI